MKKQNKAEPLSSDSSVLEASRRTFVKRSVVGTTVAMAVSPVLGAQKEKVDVWVLHGSDNSKLIQKAMEIIQQNGGFGKNVKTLALKVNAGWARTPDEGANTHPELVNGFLKAAKSSGVKEILIPEYACSNAKISFKRSGILAAAKSNKCTMIDLKRKKKTFKKVDIPNGKKLKSETVAREFLDADAIVNMPVAKHHGGAKVTCAMKNWMGAVGGRRNWHKVDLHQCIADFSTFIKPVWTIVDATRCIMDKGPQGPAKNLKKPQLLILSKDQVAADSYTSIIFQDSPYKIKYLKYAEKMGIGVVDHAKMNIHKIEVS
jgi:uncharacterized protein (DUF362 family)